tara:strand:+ start:8501 stop:8803 length:303 start_codon:yes stop_codon:yes gene_type:complete
MIDVYIKYFDTLNELNAYLKEDKTDLFEQLVYTIRISKVFDLDEVTVAKFIMRDTDTSYNVMISRDDWDSCLNTALKHYISIEEYEQCQEIKKLIKEISN